MNTGHAMTKKPKLFRSHISLRACNIQFNQLKKGQNHEITGKTQEVNSCALMIGLLSGQSKTIAISLGSSVGLNEKFMVFIFLVLFQITTTTKFQFQNLGSAIDPQQTNQDQPHVFFSSFYLIRRHILCRLLN